MSKKIKAFYKAVIYCRLSKEDGDKAESNSIVNQKSYCENYISKMEDIQIVHEPIVDDGVSGVTFDRNGFRKLEKLAENGTINCVVVKDLSRFSRNYIDAGRYLEKVFPNLGVRFIAINDNYDSTASDSATDSFILPFKNLMNESYCKDISVKIRSSLETRWKSGQFVGSFCPYGYMKDPNNKNQLIVDENVRDNVKMIYSLYKDGLSIQKIANRLNELGILSPLEYKQSIGVNYDTVFKTSEVAKWDYKAIQRVLTNEVYIGVLAQGKQCTPNYKVKVVQQKDESEWVRVENAHEPIISYEDFHNIKEMMKRDVRSLSGADDGNENVLSGFLFCGDCGATMIRKTIPSKNKKYIYHVCGNNKKTKACSSHSIATAKLEDIVLEAIHRQIALVSDIEKALELIDELPNKQAQSFGYRQQIQLLEDEIDKYKKIKVRLYEDFIDKTISQSEYAEFKVMYTAKIEEKEQAVFRLKKEDGKVIDLYAETKSWVTIFKKYENIEQLNRRVLMSLVHAVKIYENHKVEVVFKYSDEYHMILKYLFDVANEVKLQEGEGAELWHEKAENI